MQCLTCELTSICKIYEFVSLQKAVADISINSCRVKRGASANVAVPQISSPTPEIGLGDRRSAEAIASVSERIRTLNAKPVEPFAPRLCEGCQEESSALDFVGCFSCGKELCEGCLMHDTKTNKRYCEACWDKI